MHKDNLEEFNYETTDTCDGCKKHAHGMMFHAHDAMGLATPVLFLCDRCYKPTWWQRHLIDRPIGFVKRMKNKARYYATTTRAERAERKAKVAAIRAKIAARKAAEAQA